MRAEGLLLSRSRQAGGATCTWVRLGELPFKAFESLQHFVAVLPPLTQSPFKAAQEALGPSRVVPARTEPPDAGDLFANPVLAGNDFLLGLVEAGPGKF